MGAQAKRRTAEAAEAGARADAERRIARDGRMVALVIAGTMLVWLGAQWAGPQLGLDPSYAFLFDLAALAGFVWALAVTWQIWQRQKQMK
jgi:hypothetical protein